METPETTTSPDTETAPVLDSAPALTTPIKPIPPVTAPAAAAPVTPWVIPAAILNEEARPYMTVEAAVMGACHVCAGETRVEDGAIVCAKKAEDGITPAPIDCVLPRLLTVLRVPAKSGDMAAGITRQHHLSAVASPQWCLQNAANTGPLPE